MQHADDLIKRLSLREYGKPTPLRFAALSLGISVAVLTELLITASERIKNMLGIADAVNFSGSDFQIIKIAGVIRLSTNIELEVVPKFLEFSHRWKEDFYFVVSLNRFGIYLNDDNISAALTPSSTLLDALAEILIDRYLRLRRKAIRTYKLNSWRDFSISGELDEVDLLNLNQDGFLQTQLELSKENTFNRVFYDAFEILLIEVRSAALKIKIKKCLADLAPQSLSRPSLSKRLPNRYSRWTVIYNLALGILRSYNLAYEHPASFALPGFIIRTADAWENLMLSSLQLSQSNFVFDKKPVPFGSHARPDLRTSILKVNPDITVVQEGSFKMILDSKYKSIGNDGSVSRADIYEMLAFLQATNCKKGLLLYPASVNVFSPEVTPGTLVAFERIRVQEVEIIGLCINLSNISAKGGYEQFCKQLAGDLTSFI